MIQKETFFQLNRFVLLGCLILSFGLPFVPVPEQWAFRAQEVSSFIEKPGLGMQNHPRVVPEMALEESLPPSKTESAPKEVISIQNTFTLVVWLYWIGVAAFGINFILQFTILLYRSYTSPIIRDGQFRIVELSGDKAPCSFGNTIFINPEKYEWEVYNQILEHEKVHVQQKHSLDLVIAELMLVFQWFNPFAWLYRKELENNLEFLTDDKVLQQGDVEKTSYQVSLLKVSAPHFPLSFTTNYNQSLLKKRLVMMNAKKSNLNVTWKYLFLFPLLALFICSFNEPLVSGRNSADDSQKEGENLSLEAEGSWIAKLEGNHIMMQFFDHYGERGSAFLISELKGLLKNDTGTISLAREAGTLYFSGRLEGDEGMGRYKFIGNPDFNEAMYKEGIDVEGGKESMTFFLLDITTSYVLMLKEHGYPGLRKEDLTSLAAQSVGKQEIKEQALLDVPEPKEEDEDPLSVMINFKASGVTEEYIRSFEGMGYKNISPGHLINFKSLGVTPEYVKSFEEAGYKNIPYGTIVDFKSVGVTPEFIKSFEDAGYKDISYSTIINLKATGVSLPTKNK
ncbi:M56 family metallopeptidase [Nafulsella turpanensis]|uniref:M56 family metallopeptidase n=1 Tax=Nafulsella turpanensis TaxID=1265690 RepID=UPI00135F17D4|nr:M56 family metallopeptidase [Nafulsella turpanensis]